MSVKKAPAAPPSPVTTQQNQQAYGNASSDIGQVSNNPFPMQAYNFFAPGMMSMTPYGFDPNQVGQQGMFAGNQGQNMFGAGNQVMNTAFDPQNALYDRTRQQVQDQTRASQAARGIQTTPYGAGLEDQTMANFNIDWQNAQLGRQAQGIQAGSTAYGSGINTEQGGYGIAASAPQFMQTYLGNMQNLGTNAFNPQAQGAQLYSNLFGAGTAAQQNAYQQQLEQFKQNQASQQAFWGGIGKLGGTLLTAPMTGGGSVFGNFMGGL